MLLNKAQRLIEINKKFGADDEAFGLEKYCVKFNTGGVKHDGPILDMSHPNISLCVARGLRSICKTLTPPAPSIKDHFEETHFESPHLLFKN